MRERTQPDLTLLKKKKKKRGQHFQILSIAEGRKCVDIEWVVLNNAHSEVF